MSNAILMKIDMMDGRFDGKVDRTVAEKYFSQTIALAKTSGETCTVRCQDIALLSAYDLDNNESLQKAQLFGLEQDLSSGKITKDQYKKAVAKIATADLQLGFVHNKLVDASTDCKNSTVYFESVFNRANLKAYSAKFASYKAEMTQFVDGALKQAGLK
jgi:hypothetical protein